GGTPARRCGHPARSDGDRAHVADAGRGALRGAARADARMGLRGRAAAVALVALTAVGCGSGGTSSPTVTTAAARPASPFGYQASAPLGYRNAGRVNGPYPIAVDDVSYAVPGGRVEGYLALPPGKGRVPAVIFLHGSGEG